MTKTTSVPYSVAARWMQPGDLLLWRPHGKPIPRARGWIVAQLTRSGRHCHASMVARAAKWWTTIGTEEGRGGIEEPLEELVNRYPGKIDLYRANAGNRWPEFSRDGTVAWARQHVVGRRYGWWATIRCALSRVVFLRWIPYFCPDRRDEANGTKPPNCSAAVSMATRLGGGVDPVKGRSDISTEPGDLAGSLFYEDPIALVPDGQEGE
jgi:hypothetical protein